MGKFNFDLYADMLKRWVIFSQKHLYRCPELDGLVCYGNGTGTNWGMQTHLKAMSAFAVAALTEEIDFSDSPITKDELLSDTLAMLRFALRTHLTGDFVCTDGKRWGHSWIFALGIERMFHAIELLDGYMTEEDKARLKSLMISESDFILNDYPIVAGLVENIFPVTFASTTPTVLFPAPGIPIKTIFFFIRFLYCFPYLFHSLFFILQNKRKRVFSPVAGYEVAFDNHILA